jgi:hypothetical protein
MEGAMSEKLTIQAAWESFNGGEPEENACFAMFEVKSGPVILTEGYDEYVKRLRNGPLVSAYYAAEWLAWNWWRLRWEPRTRQPDWPFAHDMATIGHGYVWPNLVFQSDGARIVLVAKPSIRSGAKPFRFIADRAMVVSAAEFEGAVDDFISQVLDRLLQEGVGETNLARVWRDVLSERVDAASSFRRRIEALIGAEPDEGDEAVERLSADAAEIGSEAVAELAADTGVKGVPHSLDRLKSEARDFGHEAKPSDVVRLANVGALPRIGDVPAWKRGAQAARALREQEHLGAASLSNDRLEGMIAVVRGTIEDKKVGKDLSFALDEATTSRVVLRSRWETGRRFALARLLGDRIAAPNGGKLRSATRAYTYRQKMQRSFAAELLCPLEPVLDMLQGDFSAESIEDAARHFAVSDRTVRTLLVNNGCLDREDLEGDFEREIAA